MLCTSYLDDCYQRYAGEIGPFDNTIANYSKPEVQASYSVMYFAKSVGCWRGLRRLTARDETPSHIISIGAGPMFCIMGWFFDQPPKDEQEVSAIDAIPWAGVRGLPSHVDLLTDILGGKKPRYLSGEVFPDGGTPQASSVGITKHIRAGAVPKGATLFLPMVMNHVLGYQAPLGKKEPLVAWLREIEKRVGRIVLVDMQYEPRTQVFWSDVGEVLGINGPPPTINFREESVRFRRCYRDRQLAEGRRPECDRRTGFAYRQFCAFSGAVFEPQFGWRWLRQPT